jgi:hypothetical protein
LRQGEFRLRPSTLIAWAVWATTIACLILSFLYGVVDHGGPIDAWEMSTLVSFFLFVVAFSTVGALVASRQPRNAVGWIMCWSGLAYAVAGAVVSYAETRGDAGASLSAFGEVMMWIGAWAWILGSGPPGTLLLLLFPDGRLPSRGFRPVAVLGVVGILLIFAAIAFQPGPIDGFESATNPVGIRGAGQILDVAGGVGGAALLAGFAGALVSVVVRYRRAGAEVRQQLKWLTYAAGFVGLCIVVSVVVESLIASGDVATEVSNLLVTVSLTALPVAIGIAILKHRLYDIDIIINRTLVYGGLTALLAATYFGIVVLLQGVIPAAGDSDLTIAGSTLAVAALFRPLRARVQGFIDRRFYRRKVDAQRTLESFSSRLRDDVDLDHLSADLLGVVRETMQPEHASLWLRPEAGR